MASTAIRVIKNTSYLYIKMGITMFISLYITRLILNSLGASDFGIHNIVGGAIGMLGFLNGAMASATQRYMSYAEGERNKEKQKCIFNVSIILHFSVAVLVGVLLIIVGYFFFNGILNIPTERKSAAIIIYGSLIISTMFTVMTVPYDAMINAHENMFYYAAIGIFESVLKLLVAFITVFTLADKLIIYGILMACIPLVTLSIMRVYCHKKYEECVISHKKYFDKKLLREMTVFAGWNFLATITSLLSQQGINIVLNHFFGTIVNAAQGITYQLSGQLGALSTQATKALNPVIVKDAGSKQRDAMYRASSIGSKIIFFFTTIIFIPVILSVNPLLKWWLKIIPAYTQIFIILYFLVNIIDTLCLFFNTAISGIGKIEQMSILNSVFGLLPFVGCIFLFYLGFAPYWVYVLMIISSTLKLFSRIYFSYRICNFDLKNMIYNDIARPLFCVAFVIILSVIIKPQFPDTNFAVITFSLLNMAFYALTYYLVALTVYERSKINKLCRDLYQKASYRSKNK